MTLLVSFAGSVTATIAWLYEHADLAPKQFKGISDGAYFAYGDGSYEHPYGINTPRHLYNLSWLNMRGYFERNNAQTYYFELDPNLEGGVLDCEGWTIPPIGTAEHPFYWTFNGNSIIVDNLNISNQISDYNQKPYNTNEFWTSDPQIVGLFGVVGALVNNAGTQVSTPYTYNTSANKVYDLGITNLTVKTQTSSSLIGMVAGYVNGTVKDVAVNSSTITVNASNTAALTAYTSNLSDYGVIGYARPAYKSTVKQVEETVYSVDVKTMKEFNATDEGDANGWGGSINMKAMYERLTSINTAASSTAYQYRTVVTHNANGGTSTNNSTLNANNSDYTPKRYSPGNYVGNFNMITRPSPNDVFRYLCGGERNVDYYYEYVARDGYYITNGTYYLYTTNGTLNRTTSTTDRSVWYIPSSGSGTIYTTYNNTTYYLRNNGGTLQATTNTTNATIWNIAMTDSKIAITNGGYQIDYSGGNFTLVTYTVQVSLSNGNGHYMNHPASGRGNVSDSTTVGDTAKWTTNGTYFYSTSSGTNYYLRYRNNNNRLVVRDGTDYRYTLDSDGYLYSSAGYYVYFDGTSWAASTSNKTKITVDYLTSPTNSLVKTSTGTTASGPDNALNDSKTTSVMNYTSANTTYFPLNVTTDGGTVTGATNITNNYSAKDSNTGYVIAGSLIDDTNNLGYADGTKTSDASRIRVSRYGIGDIGTSYSTNDGEVKDSKVYTFNSSGNQVTMSTSISNGDKYEKYSKSKASFYTGGLKGSSYVYGLHFMASQISMTDIVSAQNIRINKTNYSNYQLPVNSIDFNLKEKGYINFFAGTYFSGNDSFFSLHQVYRNSSNTITEIKEIEEIYGNPNKPNYSYIFKYKGDTATYSKPYRFDGAGTKYELSSNDQGTTPYQEAHDLTDISTYTTNYGYVSLFDTVRITNYRNGSRVKTLTDDALYYFEIPMNAGEYCLGSVNGGTGGYLLYLDIGANAMKIQRTEIYEKFTADEKTYEYPLGVSLMEPSLTLTENVNIGTAEAPVYVDKFVADDLNTALVYISPNYSGDLTMSREDSGNTSTVTVTRSDTTKAKPTYVSVKINTIQNNSGTSIKTERVAKSTSSKIILRMQYYDWLVQYGQLRRTVVTDTSNDGGTSYSRVLEQFDVAADGTETAVETIKVYNSNGGALITSPDVRANLPFSYTGDGSVILQFTYSATDSNAAITRTLVMTKVTSETAVSYTYAGYKFTFTFTSGKIEIVVDQKGTGTFTIGGTAVTGVGQKIVIETTTNQNPTTQG